MGKAQKQAGLRLPKGLLIILVMNIIFGFLNLYIAVLETKGVTGLIYAV